VLEQPTRHEVVDRVRAQRLEDGLGRDRPTDEEEPQQGTERAPEPIDALLEQRPPQSTNARGIVGAEPIANVGVVELRAPQQRPDTIASGRVREARRWCQARVRPTTCRS
jgi:hypothetical protein